MIFDFILKYNFPVVAFCVSFIPLMIGRTWSQILLVAIPWSLKLSYAATTSFMIIIWQVIYFYILCFYLKLKIKEINDSLKEKMEKNIVSTIKSIIMKLHKIYIDIYYYNKFWSKIIAVYYVGAIIAFCVAFNAIIYGEMHFLLRLVITYSSASFITILAIYILSASTIDEQKKITYKLLNKYSVVFKPNHIRYKMKVNTKYQFIYCFNANLFVLNSCRHS